jgi:ribose transport system substrate-binding protein
VTRQRYEAFKKTITEDYPEIKIVAEQGIREPDFYGDADRAAYAMMTANQNLSGIRAVWGASGVIAAARTAGKEHLVVTTIELGLNVAVAISRGLRNRGPAVGADLRVARQKPPFLLASVN